MGLRSRPTFIITVKLLILNWPGTRKTQKTILTFLRENSHFKSTMPFKINANKELCRNKPKSFASKVNNYNSLQLTKPFLSGKRERTGLDFLAHQYSLIRTVDSPINILITSICLSYQGCHVSFPFYQAWRHKIQHFYLPCSEEEKQEQLLMLCFFLMGQFSISLHSSTNFVSSFLPFITLKGKSGPESINATKMTENFSVPCKCHRRPEHCQRQSTLFLSKLPGNWDLNPQPNKINGSGLALGQ